MGLAICTRPTITHILNVRQGAALPTAATATTIKRRTTRRRETLHATLYNQESGKIASERRGELHCRNIRV